jgi:hypothetical protein
MLEREARKWGEGIESERANGGREGEREVEREDKLGEIEER